MTMAPSVIFTAQQLHAGYDPVPSRVTVAKLKQTSLIDRLGRTFGRRFWLARSCFRPLAVCGRTDAAIGKFNAYARTGLDIGCGMDRLAAIVAHQREAARQHTAIRQGGEQLPAMGNARLEPLQRGDECAMGAFGEALGALAVTLDALTLRQRNGKSRGLQPRFKACVTIAAPSEK